MWNVIICNGVEREQTQLTSYIQRFCLAQGLEVTIVNCKDWQEFSKRLKERTPDLVIVAQNGVEGLDTITSARLPMRKVIWFSDLDFGVQAYRLCVAYFGKKPVTYQKMERALTQCLLENLSASKQQDR